MQTAGHAELRGILFDHVAEPIDLVEPAEVRRAEPAAKGLLFEAATRRKAFDGAVLGAMLFLYAMLLAAGLWMVWDVARGVAIAEHCNGRCVEVQK